MSGTLSIDGAMGLIVLALPLVMLAIVILWSVSGPATSAAGAAHAQQAKTSEAPLPGPTPDTPPAAQRAAAGKTSHATKDSEIQIASAFTPMDGAAAGNAGTSKQATAPLQAVPAALLQRPESASPEAAKAESFIENSKAEVSAGNTDEAASLLGEAIKLATQAKLHGLHARARIELADIFLSKNDPITACEQWQIARNLYHDLDETDARDSVDKKMLSSGCPTDWVLTDF